MIAVTPSTPPTAVRLDYDWRHPSPSALGFERHGGGDYTLGYPFGHMQGFLMDVCTTFGIGFGVDDGGIEGGVLGWDLRWVAPRVSRVPWVSWISRGSLVHCWV
jgi:hypothetical protein